MRGRGSIALFGLLLAACVSASPLPSSSPGGVGIDLSPRIAPRATGGDPAWIAGIPAAQATRALMDLAVHATPGGPAQPLLGVAKPIERGQTLVVLGDPVSVHDTVWVRVYLLPQQTGGPADFFTWIPASGVGNPAVEATCPPVQDSLSSLATFDPFTRARCQGAATFTIEGRTANLALPVWYHVKPAWIGPWQSWTQLFSMHAGIGTPMDVRVPPGLQIPPSDITVRADVHVADRATGSCTRSDPNQDLPVETPTDTRLWCATQVVLERWEPLLGSEGRVFDATAPQLHRFQPSDICAGVGSGPMTFHIDPTRLDPVWLEPASGGAHIVAWFGPEYRVASTPDLVIVDGYGQIVVRDGTTVDPDKGLAGHFLCYEGSGLFIS
jgi:hypothetical protein